MIAMIIIITNVVISAAITIIIIGNSQSARSLVLKTQSSRECCLTYTLLYYARLIPPSLVTNDIIKSYNRTGSDLLSAYVWLSFCLQQLQQSIDPSVGLLVNRVGRMFRSRRAVLQCSVLLADCRKH